MCSLLKTLFTLSHVIVMMDCSLVRRPFYNIAHMANTVDDVVRYVESGANAIECDVQFDAMGRPSHLYHGFPCDCFRNCFKSQTIEYYLEFIKNITTPGHVDYAANLTLIILDLKLNVPDHLKPISGKHMFDILVHYLFGEKNFKSKLKILLSVQYISDETFIKGFMDRMIETNMQSLDSYFGWDVSFNEQLCQIGDMYRRLGNVRNIWQSDGITNCLSYVRSLNRVSNAILLRDDSNEGYMKKVIHWTIDWQSILRFDLRSGVDGLITNHPELIVAVLNENEFQIQYRLADHNDNPWSKFIE